MRLFFPLLSKRLLFLCLAALLITLLLVSPPAATIAQQTSAPLSPRPRASAEGASIIQMPAAPAFVTEVAWDSGWFALNPGQTLTLTHSLGGDIDAYVVDLRFLSGIYGVNQYMYGGNVFGANPPVFNNADDQVGAYWHNLTTTTVKVTRRSDDVNSAAKVRLRIFRAPGTIADSGWQNIPQNGFYNFNHGMPGTADDYMVYLEFKDTLYLGYGINHRYYGGFTDAADNQVGAYWFDLTNTHIWVGRQAANASADQVRVRLWYQPKATYDSGWTALSAGHSLSLSHGIGGNPDDYVVDLQFKAATGGNNINQICYGGCDLGLIDGTGVNNFREGAYWRNLTGSSIAVSRRTEDPYADQVRVRIWNAWKPPVPDYDSQWRTSPSVGGIYALTHGLGGDINDYLVYMLFQDFSLKTHNYFYGVKKLGSVGFGNRQSSGDQAGMGWWGLTSSLIAVNRAADDHVVGKYRIIMWRMPKPDYDSGWQSQPSGSQIFTHGVIGQRDHFFVDLQFRTTGGSVHQQKFGGSWDSSISVTGATWLNFFTLSGSDHIYVTRYGNDTNADQVRVRIWRMSQPDYETGYVAYSAGEQKTLTHNLDVDAGNLFIDVTANNNNADHKAFYGRVDVLGSAWEPTYSQNDILGFAWDSLDSAQVRVMRQPQDIMANKMNVRIWKIPFSTYLPVINR